MEIKNVLSIQRQPIVDWAIAHYGLILLLLLLQVFVFLLVKAVKRIYFHPLSEFPGPPIYAITNLPFVRRLYIQGTWWKHAAAFHQRFGPVVRIGPDYLMVDGSAAWPDVFGRRKQEFTKPAGYFDSADHLSIVNAPYEHHRRIRRLLSPAFSEAALSEQEPVLITHVNHLMSCLDDFAQRRQPVNMANMLIFTTFDIIGQLGFSKSLGCLENESNRAWVLSTIQGAKGLALRQFLEHYPILRSLIRVFSSSIARSSRNRSLASQEADTRRRLGHSSSSRDYMAHMMGGSGSQAMSELEIAATSGALFVGGSETTATALSGLLYFLSEDTERCRLVTSEVRSRFASRDGIGIRDCLSLQYLCACIEETLRLYPPVADLPPRVSPGAIVGGRYIPAGTRIFVSLPATFRNPAHFKDASSFRPERWLPKSHPLHDAAFDDDNRPAVRPFSYGSRDCLGQSLAYAEMRLIAARFLFAFDFERRQTGEDWLDTQRNFILWEKAPLEMTLYSRSESSTVSYHRANCKPQLSILHMFFVMMLSASNVS
ncbi:hypothetical protein L249_5734 [Ophiocordyceps polyrhachis-furcata BCC 54312]|uniref:Cytochrome P450 n=1 Tax=Ophiocordyceps polyrhachis-furcata BCC 54312 TaxID=1330021 RepID=A0A367KZT2_9HYPO|nr:hypothetical protein L249_5734 [Ophiocordyceps polyrhachis-furcata BCC 54312]